MNCGIYKITNSVNGKVYIGSSDDINRRHVHHIYSLQKSRHGNSHLQRAWNKYGGDSFVFEVLLYCDKENLTFYEQRAMDEHRTLNNKFGYNICKAERSNIDGDNYNAWKKKNSELKKGKNNPMWGKSGRDSPTYKKECSKETRQKISESHMGKKASQETRKKLSESKMGKNNHFYGKKHTKETMRKISGKNHYNAKSVVINGKQYDTMKEAAKDLKVCRQTIAYRIKTNKLGYRQL